MGKHSDLPDFDTLLALNESDPAALEKLRKKLTRKLLANSPEEKRRRLEGLQCRINMELERARTPEARCRRLSTMMVESFVELHQCLHHPDESLKKYRARTEGKPADILPLRPRKPIH